MSRLPDAFHQDKALRDAALDVLKADVEHARQSLSGKAVAGRVAGRIGDGAKDVLEIAKSNASDREGLLAGLIAIIALWFAREPIADLLGFATDGEAGDGNDDPADPEAELDEDGGLADKDPEGPATQESATETPEAPSSEPKSSAPEPLNTGDTP